MKITASLRALLVILSLVMVFSLFSCEKENNTLTDAQGTDAKTDAPTSAETEDDTNEPTAAETTDGETDAPECEHVEEIIAGTPATCTKAGLEDGKKCTKCGEITLAQKVIPAFDHTETELPAVAPTCTATGLTAGKKCTVCNEITVPQNDVKALGHAWDNGTVAENVACGQTADITYVCTREGCNETRVDTGAVVEHDFKETDRVDATCTTAGSVSYKCDRAGCTEEKTDVIDALGHNITKVDAKDANCADAGNEEYFTCTACKAIYSDPYGENALDSVPTLGIIPDAHIITEKGYVAPTTSEAGHTAHSACEVCGKAWDSEGNEITDNSHVIPMIVPTTEYYFGADFLATLKITGAQGSKFNAPKLSDDRTYVTFSRAGESSDGNIVLFQSEAAGESGQYLVFKYRTDHATKVQLWANTLAAGPDNGTASFRTDIVADGNWHIVIYDLSASLESHVKAVDGKYSIKFARMDILENKYSEGYIDLAWVVLCDDIGELDFTITDEDKAYCSHIADYTKTATNKGDKHTIPCAICSAELEQDHSMTSSAYDADRKLYVGHCICGKEFTSEMLYVTAPVNAGANLITATQEDGFMRYTVTSEGNKDVYAMIYNNGSAITGKYIVIKYRMENKGKNPTLRNFFIASATSANTGAKQNGDEQNARRYSHFIADGEWHYMIVIPKAENTQYTDNGDGTYTCKYIRVGFNPAAYDGSCYLDIAEIAFADNMAAVENYACAKDSLPYYTVNLDDVNCSYNGENGDLLDASKIETGKSIAIDMSGKVLSTATSLKLGGWCMTPGGVAAYKYRVVKIDNEAVDSPELVDWCTPFTVNAENGITKEGTKLGFTAACGKGASTDGSRAFDLTAYAGHTIEIEVVAVTNYGAELSFVKLTNVTVQGAN